jgi:hypothetical protein
MHFSTRARFERQRASPSLRAQLWGIPIIVIEEVAILIFLMRSSSSSDGFEAELSKLLTQTM